MCLVTQTNGFRLPTVAMALERMHAAGPAASVASPRGVRILVLEPGEPGYKRQRLKNFWGNLFRRKKAQSQSNSSSGTAAKLDQIKKQLDRMPTAAQVPPLPPAAAKYPSPPAAAKAPPPPPPSPAKPPPPPSPTPTKLPRPPPSPSPPAPPPAPLLLELEFRDKDGDVIKLRRCGGSVVDYMVNGELKIKDAVLETGPGPEPWIKLSGIDRLDWKFKLSSGSFKDIIIDLTVPSDPTDAAKALTLLD